MAPTKKSASPSKSTKKVTKEKKPRAPSAYNLFMKTEVVRVKKENTKLDHKEAFKVAAANWKKSPLNKNK